MAHLLTIYGRQKFWSPLQLESMADKNRRTISIITALDDLKNEIYLFFGSTKGSGGGDTITISCHPTTKESHLPHHLPISQLRTLHVASTIQLFNFPHKIFWPKAALHAAGAFSWSHSNNSFRPSVRSLGSDDALMAAKKLPSKKLTAVPCWLSLPSWHRNLESRAAWCGMKNIIYSFEHAWHRYK